MGKKDNRVAFINPIAAGRSSGAVHSGPSIKDYLNRPRPSWDEVKEMIKSKRKGSRTLDEFEQKLNKEHRAELDRGRKKLLNSEEKKSPKRQRSRSSSSSNCSTDSSINRKRKRSSRKRKKRDKTKHSKRKHEKESTSESSDSEWEEIVKVNENQLREVFSESEWKEAEDSHKRKKRKKCSKKRKEIER